MVAASDTPGATHSVFAVGDDYTQIENSSNNSSVRHENPDLVGRDGDTDQLRAYLIEKMVSRLGQGTVEIEQGEYQRARDLLGDEYNDLLDKYVDVEGPTGAGNQLERTHDEQDEYTTAVQSYRETYDEYQDAKQNGNEERARQLARELEQHEPNVSQSGSDLTRSYERLGNRTGVDTTESQDRVSNITQNISAQQTDIRESEFVETSLTLTSQQSQTSYLNPLSITGQLTTTDGEPLSNRDIVLTIGSQRIQTQTDANGRIETSFRPRTLPQGETDITVRYVPTETSVYYGSNATLNTSVEPVTAAISLTESPETARFDEPVTVSGSLAVQNQSVSEIPLVVSLGGVELGTVQTTDSGSFSLSESLPADIPAGDQPLTISTPSQSQAVVADEHVSTVSVETTETRLNVSGSQSSPSSVTLSGVLSTENGTTLPKQEILLRHDGSVVATATTDRTGRFQADVSTASFDDTNATLGFTAVFPSEGTNLERSRATTEVALSSSGAAGESQSNSQFGGFVGEKTRVGIVIGAAVLVLASGIFWWWRRNNEDVNAEEVVVTGDQDRSEPKSTADDSAASAEPVSRLTLAGEALNDGRPDHAVELGYAAVRERVSARLNLTGQKQQTHWEWYQTVADQNGENTDLTALQQLTAAYEQAAYRREKLSEKNASEVLDAIELLLDTVGSDDSSVVTSD
ncbi:hypothetical protein [Haloprofundus salilacus]|uniref:hypothetical protein n=1 Tax=Haloprofundus salilacus TaxID=2876190 RepID=UPI001CCE1B51|nr:hypothetical protein [Haloprofundus salilacus]